MNGRANHHRTLLASLAGLSVGALIIATPASAGDQTATPESQLPVPGPAESTGGDADAAILEALDKLCQQEGKHWDEARRECVWLMRSKE
jgi:hypothetical protein